MKWESKKKTLEDIKKLEDSKIQSVEWSSGPLLSLVWKSFRIRRWYESLRFRGCLSSVIQAGIFSLTLMMIFLPLVLSWLLSKMLPFRRKTFRIRRQLNRLLCWKKNMTLQYSRWSCDVTLYRENFNLRKENCVVLFYKFQYLP